MDDPKPEITPGAKPRKLSRTETHDLGMIIKDRTKVLKAHVEEQAAVCLADFEHKLSATYAWDHDETWKRATEVAMAEVAKAQEVISARCAELGIPKTFAPMLGISWHNRGENAMAARRTELRRLAKVSIEAMSKAAVTKIEKQSLHLRTQVVAMGLMTPEAHLFLESLAPVEEAMQGLDFVEIEKKLEQERLPDFTRDNRFRP